MDVSFEELALFGEAKLTDSGRWAAVARFLLEQFPEALDTIVGWRRHPFVGDMFRNWLNRLGAENIITCVSISIRVVAVGDSNSGFRLINHRPG